MVSCFVRCEFENVNEPRVALEMEAYGKISFHGKQFKEKYFVLFHIKCCVFLSIQYLNKYFSEKQFKMW